MNKSNLFVGLFATILIAIAVIGFSKASQAPSQMAEGIVNYTISQTWDLPPQLNEISGITWMDNHTLACVQDENGIIFIYDLDEKSIVEEIPFAGNGDYEGIALHNNDIYIMQSDGLLYEVRDWRATDRVISSYHTGFKASNNMESLTYSVKDDCLLTVPKDKDWSADFKGIYKISLTSKKTDINVPAYKIDMTSAALKDYRMKKLQKTFNPSEIAVHPKTNEIYVLDGKSPKLMILDPEGHLKIVYKLDKINFPQPEGMTFSDDGNLYISNESAHGPANIHLVELKSAK
ncbi:MAG: SdiA-regulated domain-containing protein [Gelidibacter sp.]